MDMCIVVAVCRQTRNVFFHRICPSLSLSRNSDRLTIGPDVAELTSCVVSNEVVRPRGSGRLGTLRPSIALSVVFGVHSEPFLCQLISPPLR